MKQVTIHMLINDDQLNTLIALRRAEIKKWNGAEYNTQVLASLVNQGLIWMDTSDDVVVITNCGRLVLDSLGKESVCAQ